MVSIGLPAVLAYVAILFVTAIVARLIRNPIIGVGLGVLAGLVATFAIGYGVAVAVIDGHDGEFLELVEPTE